MKKFTTIVIAVLLLIIFVSLLFMVQVRETEVAVLKVGGKYASGTIEPGLKFKIPFFREYEKFDKRVRITETKTTQTQDSKNAPFLVQVYVGWKINDVKIYSQSFTGDEVGADRSVLSSINGVLQNVVSDYELGQFFSANTGESDGANADSEKSLTDLENDVRDKLKEPLEKVGIEVSFVGIKRLIVPPETTKDVFTNMRTERQFEQTRITNEGEKKRGEIIQRANLEAGKKLASAQREADKTRADAEAAAKDSYKGLEKHPELAMFLQKLKMLESTLKQKTTLILDDRVPPFDLLNGLRTNQLPKPPPAAISKP